MATVTTKYTISLFFQLTFMFCDLIFNCLSLFPNTPAGFLIIFIFQELFLVLSITSVLTTFMSTIWFQAGLVGVLLRHFTSAGCVVAAYACLSATLHTAWLIGRHSDAQYSIFFFLLFTLQRCLSPWYYFFYKRTALQVSDPRFYEDVDRINRRHQAN